MFNAVGTRCQAKAVTFRGAKHATTEGIFCFGLVVEGIEACKRLKTRSFRVWQLGSNLAVSMHLWGSCERTTALFFVLVFPLGCLSAAERSDGSRDRAGLEGWTTDAAVRPTESEPVPALYREEKNSLRGRSSGEY